MEGTISGGEAADLEATPRPQRATRWLAWALFVLTVAGAVARLVLQVTQGGVSDLEIQTFLYPVFGAFPVVGLVLALKRPRNPLGWLMLAMGVLLFASPGAPYSRFALERDLPGAGVTLAVDAAFWVVLVGLSGFLILLFPDGTLPSRRWRWFAWTCAVGVAALYVATLMSQRSIDAYGLGIDNPLAPDGFETGEDSPLAFTVLFAVLTLIGGAVALIGRFRRDTDPVRRAQLRWLAWAGAVVAFGYVMLFVLAAATSEDSAVQNVGSTLIVMSFGIIPVAIGIAVLRYRLYDIDLVIRKTIVFAIVAAFIALVYAGLVVGVGAAIGSRTSPALSAVAAAVVALVFQPVRARAARLADRVVYGQRATPYEVLANFSERVGETYAAEDVLERMARVVGEGVGAERSEVWLRLGGRERLAAIWPTDAVRSAVPESADAVFPVEHQGEVLGSLGVVAPANDPLTPAKRNLVTHLAAQAGLVLNNVRLTEELRARLDDLRAAQKRLVAAQDAERKRIERNIHDGAQQQLVALAVRLGLADQLIDRDPAKAHEAIAQLKVETQTALEDLRNLARGIYPPLLADEGLGAALEAQARRAAMPVETEVRLEERLAPEVEAAIYFSCLESLQNVAKYAEATRASVRVQRMDGVVTFEVADDGAGFDTTARGYGTGLQGIADRLGALDGALEVESAPGAGTVIRGLVPVVPSAG